jgi:uncharacterized coiled-coil DUF342 family protein
MKYLKKYQLFLEEDEFEVKETDKEDIKMSKEKLNLLKKHLSEYEPKKGQIDTIYKSLKDIKEIEGKIKEIIGEDPKLRNPFLVDYNNIARISKEVEQTHDEIAKDKIRADDFKQEANAVQDPTTKAALNAKVTDVNNRISTNNKNIVDKQKEIQELKLELDSKKEKMIADMENSIKKISES